MIVNLNVMLPWHSNCTDGCLNVSLLLVALDFVICLGDVIQFRYYINLYTIDVSES